LGAFVARLGIRLVWFDFTLACSVAACVKKENTMGKRKPNKKTACLGTNFELHALEEIVRA